MNVLKRKPHFVTVHEKTLVSLRTFQSTLKDSLFPNAHQKFKI